MEPEISNFVENIDAWIKQIRAEVADITDVSHIVEENTGNIQHNYELIHELKDELDQIKKELGALKLIQLVSLREKLAHKS